MIPEQHFYKDRKKVIFNNLLHKNKEKVLNWIGCDVSQKYVPEHIL
jgi:hypothetical protein